MLTENEIESIVLRESIRMRCSAAPLSIFSSTFSLLLFIPFILSQGVTIGAIARWAAPIVLLMAARTLFSARLITRLDTLSAHDLGRTDKLLRLSSMLNQTVIGFGVWIVGPGAEQAVAVPMFMTLIVVIWSIGVMANLFSDFPSFLISMPLLVLPNAAFWLLHGKDGFAIGFSMLLTTVLMLVLVRRGTQIFRDSILIRFEKDRLLEEVEIEREKTLEALRDAQAANESKAFFMAAASHDIKQPLHALALLTDTLMMSNPTEASIPILQHQRRSIDQMKEHFDALMDLGRLQRESGEQISGIQLLEFSTRIDAEIAPLCTEKGLQWNLNIVDAAVSTDPELLLRLLRNLLINAVRYTDKGFVNCSAKVEGKFIKFLVADSGCGIAPEHQKSVFKEFVRLENKSSNSEGAGLGLSIVAKIDQKLDLDMQMSSTLGHGTEFRFRIPASDIKEHAVESTI
jgi:signal transduction histidine kinase